MSQNIDRAKQAAENIEKYENQLVNDYMSKDLYLTKNKSRTKISFNDLTLDENLNYIKYSLKSSDDAFKLFDITKQKF